MVQFVAVYTLFGGTKQTKNLWWGDRIWFIQPKCEDIEATDSDSNWEDIQNERDLYPTLDLESDDWADEFTNSIRRFHGQHRWNVLDAAHCEQSET